MDKRIEKTIKARASNFFDDKCLGQEYYSRAIHLQDDFYLDDFEILPLIKEYANRFNVPVRLNKNITHKTNNVTLPYNQFISI